VTAARAALMATTAALAAAPAAAASTATLTYDEPIAGVVDAAYSLTVRGQAGEENRISVVADAGGYTVTDTGAALSARSGCQPVAQGKVRCPTPQAAGERTVFVDGAGADDRLSLGAQLPETTTEMHGGRGDDLLFGEPEHDLLLGGPGEDGLVGGTGFDVLDGGTGDDVLHGGSGFDTASYEPRHVPVEVDLARGTGGAEGERDTLTEIDEVVGGRGADVLRGGPNADTLVGGQGDARDRASGFGGDDVVIAHRARGGAGSDSLDGVRLDCGAGRDFLYRGKHHPRGPFPLDCERIVALFVMLRPDPVRTSRDAAVFEIRCHRRRRCRGSLELRDRAGLLGRADFELRVSADDPGALHRVRVPLERRPTRRLARLRIDGIRAYQRSEFRTRVRRRAQAAPRSRSR